MKLVYVAGPFTGKVTDEEQLALMHPARIRSLKRLRTEENIMRAKLLGLEVARIGACPLIPHANTDLPEFEDVQPYQFWIEATLIQMRKCDAVIFTPDWQTSSGARGEHEEALRLGMPVFYTLDELAKWLSGEP